MRRKKIRSRPVKQKKDCKHKIALQTHCNLCKLVNSCSPLPTVFSQFEFSHKISCLNLLFALKFLLSSYKRDNPISHGEKLTVQLIASKNLHQFINKCIFNLCKAQWRSCAERYKLWKWHGHVTIILGFIDQDYALRTDEPPAITDKSSIKKNTNYEKWKRSNRICLMVIKHILSITI